MKSKRPTSASISKQGQGNTVTWTESEFKPSASVASTSKSSDPKNSHPHSHHGHRHVHSSSLRKSEINQLESFIKTRSHEVDTEINQLREKLKKSGKLGSHGHLLPDPNASAALNADIISQTTGKGGMAVTGTGLGRVNLHSNRLLQQSKTETAQLSRNVDTFRRITAAPENTNNGTLSDSAVLKQVSTFLSTLKLKAEDAGISDLELRELFLPSDLMEPGDFKVHLREVTDVFQTELLYPLSKFDQRLILNMYGENDMVDIRMMLSDAGTWYEDRFGRGNTGIETRNVQSRLAEKLLISGHKKEKHSEDVEDLSRSGIFQHQTKQILSETNNNVESLHNLHDLIMEEREWDDLTNSAVSNFQKARSKGPLDTSKDLDIFLSSVSARRKSDAVNSSTYSSVLSENPALMSSSQKSENDKNDASRFSASRDKLIDLLGPSGMSQDLEHMRQLTEENARLKSEMSAFNSEFFEELEDLKFRYAKLQEIVGEDPLAPGVFGKSKLSVPLTNDGGSDTTSKLPLSRLAWSVRNSMLAMDRASEDSPLVLGPRISNATTYAPGVPTFREERNQDSNVHHRSVIAAPRGGYEPNSLQDDLNDSVYGRKAIPTQSQHLPGNRLHPYALPSDTSGHIFEGGIHGIGSGLYSAQTNDQGGNFANLCERRLVFELSNQSNPYNATNEFMGNIMELAEKNTALAKDPAKVGGLYISVPQLKEVIRRSRLSLSSEEVAVLASGFASDGNGSIDAKEFCDMVRTLLYNLTGTHFYKQSSALSSVSAKSMIAGLRGTVDARDGYGEGERKFDRSLASAGVDADDDAIVMNEKREKVIHPMLRDPEYHRLVRDLCETIITYDRQAVLGTSTNLMQTLLKPFVAEDYRGSGVMSFGDMVGVVKSLGSMFSYHEYKILSAPFILESPPAESAYPSSNLNHIKSFRDAKLSGALRGKAMTQKVVGDFLVDHHLGDLVNRPIDFHDVDQRVHEESIVEYPSFVKMVVDELEALLESKGGLDLRSHSRLPWVLKEMEFVDVLITQLENMRATARRKVLITLQYALQNADIKQVGELDGFALLTTLLNCGFRLQRYLRVQLLQAAEKSGGTLDYSRLILILLQTAIDWTHHERDIVLKILKAMGVTVVDRRQWLAKLKKLLLQSASKSKLKLTARRQSTQSRNKAESEENLLVWNQRLTEPDASGNDTEDAAVMIAPSAFLHVLRDCQVPLSPEEEATLLDCLDTERIACQEASAFTPIHHHNQQKNTARLLFGNSGGANDGFNVPMVDFQSFLAFCNRHCGSWVDTKPHLQIILSDAVATLHNPLQALHEFVTLLHSFDEKKQGFISQRAFLICCHRARLLANVSEGSLQELTEILAVDGAGEVEYGTIILQLRGICSGWTMKQLETTQTSLVHQLIRNASDHAETLRPLRNWLIHHSDLQSLILTTREFNALLREFSVLYRPEDLDLLMMEIGQEVDFQDVATLMPSSKARIGQVTEHRRFDNQQRADHLARTTWVVDTKKFLSMCLRTRPSWMIRNPRLAKHLLLSLKRMHHKRHADPNSKQNSAVELTLTIDGTEMAALEDVMNRIRAFASDEFRPSEVSGGRSGSNGGLGAFQSSKALLNDRGETLIEAEVFVYIVTNLGIELSKEDVKFLCDASDLYPEAKYINPDLLYDILHIEWLQRLHKQGKGGDNYSRNGMGDVKKNDSNEVTDEDLAGLTEAAVYALDHLQQMVRKIQVHCGRNSEEWTADLRCMFAGFDPHQQGFMMYEDFLLTLSLLNVKISSELLKDIPFIGKNRGYVQYPKIMDYILRANRYGGGSEKTNTDASGKSGSESEHLRHKPWQEEQDLDDVKRSMTIRQRYDVLSRDQRASSHHRDNQPQSPVSTLLRVVRKKMCGFIISEANVEEAWLEMLRVFQRFDVMEQKVVSPRDFCLAVSVLLDDDNIVLVKAEWEEIIEYFAVPSSDSQHRRRKAAAATAPDSPARRTTVNGEVAVDYMLFCEMVLDPTEVEKKLKEVKYSRAPSSYSTASAQSAGKLDRAKERLSSTSAKMKTRSSSVDRQRLPETLQPPSPRHRTQAWTNESIEEKFEKSSAKYLHASRQGKEYGNGGSVHDGDAMVRTAEASAGALGNLEAGSNSFRVARTQGQARRDSVTSRLRTTSKPVTVTIPSNQQLYVAGKGATSVSGRAASARRSSRFNKTS